MALVTLRFRRGTAAQWTTANPVLGLGEPGWETDSRTGKVGDGVTAWNSLTYSLGAGGGGGGGGAVTSVNGLTGAVSLTATSVGAVPTSRSVSGHALSADVTLVKADVGLGVVDNTADASKVVASAGKLTTARTINGVLFDGTANVTVADATKVPTSRTINGQPLTADVTISSTDTTKVPLTRQVNLKALTTDITLNSADIGAQPLVIGTGSTATAPVVVVANGAATPAGLPNGTVIVELS